MSNRNYKKQNPVRIGRVNLGNPAEVKRVTRLSVDLQLQTEALTKKDMRAWRNAWQYAKNVEYPNRMTCMATWRWTCTSPDAWDSAKGMC